MDCAAFYGVEGTLVTRPTIAVVAWLAANAQGLRERLTRLGTVATVSPWALPFNGVRSAGGVRALWMSLGGLSEDRLRELCAVYAERLIATSLREVGVELVQGSLRRRHRVVLMSENIDLVVRPIADRLGAGECVCNRLEIRDGQVTGRLIEPVISTLTGQWAREFAAERDIDLSRSSGYGSRLSDSLFLSGVGHPCAVAPDRALRRFAKDQQWPIVEA